MVVHARYRGELALYRAAVAHTYDEGWCLRFVRTRYGIPFKTGIGTAMDAWRDLPPSRRHSNIANPPRGYPFWWWAGIGQPGHVALSLGGGRVRSTDWPRAGQIGNTYIRDISIRWGMTPLGWGHDLNDRSVWAPMVDLSSIIWVAKHAPHTHDMVSTVEASLHARGYLDTVNDTWTQATRSAYARWQRHLGYTGSAADGIPGARSLRRLARLQPYFIVRP
jgi:hypothetical protein